jgi:hypothetical protein
MFEVSIGYTIQSWYVSPIASQEPSNQICMSLDFYQKRYLVCYWYTWVLFDLWKCKYLNHGGWNDASNYFYINHNHSWCARTLDMNDVELQNYETMLFVTQGSILGSSKLSAEMSWLFKGGSGDIWRFRGGPRDIWWYRGGSRDSCWCLAAAFDFEEWRRCNTSLCILLPQHQTARWIWRLPSNRKPCTRISMSQSHSGFETTTT